MTSESVHDVEYAGYRLRGANAGIFCQRTRQRVTPAQWMQSGLDNPIAGLGMVGLAICLLAADLLRIGSPAVGRHSRGLSQGWSGKSRTEVTVKNWKP